MRTNQPIIFGEVRLECLVSMGMMPGVFECFGEGTWLTGCHITPHQLNTMLLPHCFIDEAAEVAMVSRSSISDLRPLEELSHFQLDGYHNCSFSFSIQMI